MRKTKNKDLYINQEKRLGQKILASQLFLIVEQDAVVEWVSLRWFHQLYSPTQPVEGDDEIEF